MSSAIVFADDAEGGRLCGAVRYAVAGREFYSVCGTYLVFREDDPALTVSVNTATLDNPSLSPPEFHIWRESRIDWFETADRLARHARGKG